MASKQSPNQVASQRVANLLAARIQSGALPPGARIKLDELAAELAISRIPVRDGLRILESRGLVALKANAGARVTALTIKDMETSYRIREALEPMLLADSLPALTDADIAELGGIEAQLAAGVDVDAFLTLTRDFHFTAFSRHTAPLLMQMVEKMWDTTTSYRRAFARLVLADAGRTATMRAERALLLEAIAARDVDLAPRVLALHIRRTHRSLLDHGEVIAGLAV
jgi:DNA-binding GntR family transcriptional regulator